jgi:ABC-type ATPase involved in cell division/GNAT superfamily N-acetyltransferase
MKIQVRNRCEHYTSYRAARVQSLFNVESGCNFSLDVELDIDDDDWQIGVVVGPSGSGKTSIGRLIFGGEEAFWAPGWQKDRPIVDGIAPDGDFNDVTGALAAVGLGSVPPWLRPHHVLSGGEKFRADLARLVCEAPARAVVDEFTSVVDRQIARFGALAFGKAWRRTQGKVVLLTPHYDIIDWVEPDWVLDTSESGGFRRGRSLWRRPRFELEIVRTDWRYWPEFEPHHYLKLPRMIGALCYVGLVEGERVCHMAMSTAARGKDCEARGCRLVVKPEWQGAGVGMRFLNACCQLQLDGATGARMPGRSLTTIFHTSHPGLAAALRRDQKWRQVSAVLHGGHKGRSRAKSGVTGKPMTASGYGGHLRATQGFRFQGERCIPT